MTARYCRHSRPWPAHRELVWLRYVEDLEYSIIAERLELPLGTVKVRLHRLHAALRQTGNA